MITDLKEHLNGITIGIKYRANFSVIDNLGEITDRILYKKKSLFNSKSFPKVFSTGTESTLLNEVTKDSLFIDNTNIILTVNFDSRNFNVNDLDKILEHFKINIVDDIMMDFGIVKIRRIGFVNIYHFLEESVVKNFCEKTAYIKLNKIKDVNLSFSTLIDTDRFLIKNPKKKINDFCNANYKISIKNPEDGLSFSLDFQKLFNPLLNDSSEINFKEFCDRAMSYNKNVMIKWINDNFSETK